MMDPAPDGGFRSVGQPVAERMVRLAAARSELGRTLLVHGPRGAGKDAFVDDLLAFLFCAADPSERPCNACRGCRDGRARTHQDLVVGSPDAWREARSAGESIVAAARRWLLDAAGAPTIAARRVVVISGADGASEQAQNALLKVLEEPSDRHTFILVADEAERLLPTIRSRCRTIRVGPLPRATLTDLLVDRMRLPQDLADVLAQLSAGLAGRAIGYATDKAGLEWRRRVQAELMDVLERGRADRLSSVRELLDQATRLTPAESPEAPDAPDPALGGSDDASASAQPRGAQRAAAVRVVDVWLDLARDLLVAAAGRETIAPSRELGPDFGATALRIGREPILQALRALEETRAGLDQNAAPRLALEAAMLRWPHLTPAVDRRG